MAPPASTSASRNRVNNKLDFPLPVRPTTPRVVPGGTSISTFSSTNGDSSLYLMETLWNSTLPLQGHPDATKAVSDDGELERRHCSEYNDCKASPAFCFSSGIFLFDDFFSLSNLSLPTDASSESRLVNSFTLIMLIIFVSKSVKQRTAQVRRPVIDNACVSPHPADPAFNLPVRVRSTVADAVANTIKLPRVSSLMESHRSRDFTV
mmetsp:Transcript_18428/g.27309  ORF Transcript_18428/g.27309 Transcript_18428/m.27309 type:complete len:207 (+) Transcript_18428:1602-2222(+)